MSDTEAIPGGAVFDSFKKLVNRPAVKQEITKQKKIASLVGSDSFRALREVIDYYISDLQKIPVDPKTDTVESVGFRYLVSQVTIEYLTDIRDMPERYKKLREANNETENA